MDYPTTKESKTQVESMAGLLKKHWKHSSYNFGGEARKRLEKRKWVK